MSDHQPSEFEHLETALRQLTPTAPAFGKEKVLFDAGQVSGKRGRWRLALLAAVIGVVIGITGTMLGGLTVVPVETTKVVVVHVPVHVDVPPAVPESAPNDETPPIAIVPSPPPSSGAGYLQMRDQALRFGIENLPPNVPMTTGSSPPR